MLPQRVALVSAVAAANEFDYFVSEFGNDSNTGRTPAQAFRTLAKAATMPVTKGIGILAGSFLLANGFAPYNDGTEEAPIVIGAVGTGPMPVLYNAVGHSGTWGAVFGDVYRIPSSIGSYGGVMAWLDTAGGRGTTSQIVPLKKYVNQTSAAVSITQASPAVVSWPAHGMANGNGFYLTTTGALLTGLAVNTLYYLVNATADTFQLALTAGGAAINTTGSQSGTHTGHSTLPPNGWAIAGDAFLYVNIGRPLLSTDVVQVPPNSNPLFNLDGKNNVTLRGFAGRLSGSDAVGFATTTATGNLRVEGLDLSFCNGGLVHGGTGAAVTGLVVDGCYLHDQYNLQNAVSIHCDAAAGSGEVRNCTIRRISGRGITCHDTATLLCYKNTLDGAGFAIIGGGAGAGALHTFIGNRQYNQPPERTGSEYYLEIFSSPFAVKSGTTIVIENHTMALGAATVAQRGIKHGSGDLTVKNLLFYGNFELALTAVTFGDPRSSSYVGGSLFGFQIFNWYTSGLTNTLAGTGDVSYGTTSPFNDLTNGDLTLKSGSPGSLLRGAGIAIPGVTTGTPPDIGYTGAA